FRAEGPALKFGGAGWLGYGAIAASIDTMNGDKLTGKALLSSGAQVVLDISPSGKLDIQAGIGAGGGHTIVPKVTTPGGGYVPFGVGPYVAQANFTLHREG